jgi:hypothetical protein
MYIKEFLHYYFFLGLLFVLSNNALAVYEFEFDLTSVTPLPGQAVKAVRIEWQNRSYYNNCIGCQRNTVRWTVGSKDDPAPAPTPDDIVSIYIHQVPRCPDFFRILMSTMSCGISECFLNQNTPDRGTGYVAFPTGRLGEVATRNPSRIMLRLVGSRLVASASESSSDSSWLLG